MLESRLELDLKWVWIIFYKISSLHLRYSFSFLLFNGSWAKIRTNQDKSWIKTRTNLGQKTEQIRTNLRQKSVYIFQNQDDQDISLKSRTNQDILASLFRVFTVYYTCANSYSVCFHKKHISLISINTWIHRYRKSFLNLPPRAD